MTDIRNKEEFEKALNHSGIQVMMFTAFWCPDCMYIKPFLPEIEEEFNIELNESDMNPYDFITAGDVIAMTERYVGDVNG